MERVSNPFASQHAPRDAPKSALPLHDLHEPSARRREGPLGTARARRAITATAPVKRHQEGRYDDAHRGNQVLLRAAASKPLTQRGSQAERRNRSGDDLRSARSRCLCYSARPQARLRCAAKRRPPDEGRGCREHPGGSSGGNPGSSRRQTRRRADSGASASTANAPTSSDANELARVFVTERMMGKAMKPMGGARKAIQAARDVRGNRRHPSPRWLAG
jgi:hypothetical protein